MCFLLVNGCFVAEESLAEGGLERGVRSGATKGEDPPVELRRMEC